MKKFLRAGHMSFRAKFRVTALRAQSLLKSFALSKAANVAIIFGLSLVPLTMAAGVGLDMSRAMVVRSRLTEALDAAGLAVGGTTGLSDTAMQTMAQQYFNANYTTDSSFGTPAAVSVSKTGQVITLSTNVPMPTTLMKLAGMPTLTVHATSKITYGQTKLRVALVLDNTGSMTDADSTGLTKISALKTATKNLLTLLQGAATNPGDVQVSIIPFSKDVKYGSSYYTSSWIDWTDFDSAPSNGSVSTSVGPGSSCPYSNNSNGYSCMTGPTNGSSTTSTVPSSGSYKGYICPSRDSGKITTYKNGHYYNGCYNSVPTKTTTTTQTDATPTTVKQSCSQTGSGTITCNTTSTTTGSTTTNSSSATTNGWTADSTSSSSSTSAPSQSDGTKSCQGSGNNKKCTWTRTIVTTTTVTTITAVGVGPYNHTWIANAHSTWTGCFMDRTQNYDVANTTPTSTATNFPAENSSQCPGSSITAMSYDWTNLSAQVDAMVASGGTNQPIGLVWGWQSLSSGDPFNASALPSDTSQVIIILSDGLNTLDRWYGDGTNQSTSVDNRMTAVCSAVKTAGITIYSVFVDIAGASGNSAVMQSCATDDSHYFDLTTSASISTAFATIGQQITNLRVSQ